MGARGWMLLALAGATGTLLRYAVGGWIARATSGGFPWETCAINVVGCAAIGALAAWADHGGFSSPAVRIALMAGLLGGFTTFSSFGLETFRLAEDGQWSLAVAYVGLTNLGGFVAVWAAYRAIRILG